MAAAALAVGGVLLGVSLTGSHAPSSGLAAGAGSNSKSQPPQQGPAGPPQPPATVCGQVQASSGPGLCMVNQSSGPSGTAFALRGSHFAPGTSVTFSLTEVGPPPQYLTLVKETSPHHAAVGRDGTFTVPVSQLDARSFPLGQVTVVASDGGTRPDGIHDHPVRPAVRRPAPQRGARGLS